MKKAILISCFDWYEKRLKTIESVLKQSYMVKVYMSDFNHHTKQYIKSNPCEYIHVKKYKKNMSIARMISHHNFAKKMYSILNYEKPDLIYALIPPNSVSEYCMKYKKKCKNTKLIFDIIDMWPESMPMQKFHNTYPFKKWAHLRNGALKYADYVFTECTLYQETLGQWLPSKYSTLHLTKRQTEQECERIKKIIDEKSEREKELTVCYLGSINNIIDIDRIVSIIKELKKEYTVKFKIIGDGENRELFINAIENIGVVVDYYGKIYDEMKKIDILATCDCAINIMKESVKVGLTIKSIDYMSYGLPMINNIKGDTWKIINDYRIGINVGEEIKFDKEQRNLIKNREVHIGVLEVYNENFNECRFIKKINCMINEVG